MFQCTQLSTTLQNGRILFPPFDYSIQEKERLAIIAEEGNGKSTLLKIMAGIDCPYTSISGSIQSNLKIGYLSQQLDPKWNHKTCLDYLLTDSPEQEISIEQYNLCEQLDTICHQMKLDSQFIYNEQPIQTLSGGEKVRLQLIKLVSLSCDLYCLDEPTNDLDIDTLEWLETWMNTCPKPIIYVSHDITLLSKTATRILHLEQRNKKSKPVITLFQGGYQEYVSARAKAHEKDIQVSENEKREYRKQKQRLNDLHNKVQSDLRSVSRQAPHVAKNLKDKMRSVKSSQANLERQGFLKVDSFEEEVNFFFEDSPLPSKKNIISFHQESLSIEERCLISSYDFSLYGQDKVVITGKNGCGKSLWMKSLYQQLKDRDDIQLGYMPQNYTDFFTEDETPVSFLSKYDHTLSDIQTMLGSLKFIASEMIQPISDCSEGQKAKLYIAMLILNRCNVLLLDEPSRNLSPLSQPVLIQALQEFNGCIVCVSHDRTLIQSVFTRHIKIQDRQWIEEI